MYNNKKIIHIVAVGENGEIGANNSLLWHIPEDLKYFKDKTIGHVCIAGRKTVESFPKPLSRRLILPVGKTRKGYDNLDDALGAAQHFSNALNTDCIYIIGGSSLYSQTEAFVDEAYITRVECEFPHADTFYNIPSSLRMVEASDVKIYNNTYAYSFTRWTK